MRQLIPDKHYIGAAWYQKEINIHLDWEGKNIELLMEWCHWETQVWIDDQKELCLIHNVRKKVMRKGYS